MWIFRTILFACLASLPVAAVSSSAAPPKHAAYTPPAGSPERKEILELFRREFRKNLRQDVVFEVGHFRVKSGWAWIELRPRTADGSGRYEPESALLHREKGVWKILDYAPGECTGDPDDSPDCDPAHLYRTLKSKYKAPAEIFPEP